MFLNFFCIALVGAAITQANPVKNILPETKDDTVPLGKDDLKKVQESYGNKEVGQFPAIPDFVGQNTDDLLEQVTAMVDKVTQPTKDPQSLTGLAEIFAQAIQKVVNENAKTTNRAVNAFLTAAQAFVRSTKTIVDAKTDIAMSVPRIGYNIFKKLDE